MDWLRLLLLPLSVVYRFVLSIRHLMYNVGIIKSYRFGTPTICVGNLSFGGTGKTPHVEYLARLLLPHMKVAILSRGYKRKTKGFVLASAESGFTQIGDEPMQYVNKFPQSFIAVDANRRRGIARLENFEPKPGVVLLDDAFQHRKIRSGLNILLTDFHNLYPIDHLFPAGNLRDTVKAAKRADIIVVTKTPKVFSPFTRRRLHEIIKPRSHQSLHFSYLKYGILTPVLNTNKLQVPHSLGKILLFCGIANPYPLQEYLYAKCNHLEIMTFADHHDYTKRDIDSIIKRYDEVLGKNKIMVTTEKDAMRLLNSPYLSRFENLPLFYIPIEVRFHESQGQDFDNQVLAYVRENS
jgi:tetraacyldisaccharide 4'-kinase